MSSPEPKPELKPELQPEPGGKPKTRPKPQSGDSRRGAVAGLIIAIVILVNRLVACPRSHLRQQDAGLPDVRAKQLQCDRAGALEALQRNPRERKMP
ncbi:hypothetical protein ACVWW4_001000 [Bradyrhizobium sp. LB7.1]